MKLSRKQIIDELWIRGELSFKLDSSQKELYDLFYNSNHKTMVWLLARRSGKTHALCVLALEQCIRYPHSIVKFVSPTKIQVNQNVRPLFRKIIEDCPEQIKPEFSAKDYIYYFPNGSEIQLAGTDSGHAEKLRGGDSNLWFIDEAGSCDDLKNVVKSILLPTTLITNGKGILASTPPLSAEHEFIDFIDDAERKQSLIKKTIDDNPRITKEQKDELILELGGPTSEATRRELYCEILKDPKSSALPEFTEALATEIVKEWPKPPFLDTYVAMDLGGKDLTALVFGYYDFRGDKIIIEDELSFDFSEQDNHISSLVAAILNKEKDLWKNPLTDEIKIPHTRSSDINLIVTNEIYTRSQGKLFFQTTKKDDKASAVHNLRVLLANKKIIINPRCKTLVSHLKNVKWGKGVRQDQFERSDTFYHYDFVDALIYFIKNISFKKNPYPKAYDLNLRKEDAFATKPQNVYSDQRNVYRQIFGIKRKI